MCIVADSVNDVSNTKIAAFHIGYKIENSDNIIPAQLVVYTNAFILPVYNKKSKINNPITNTIIPLDMSNYSEFFKNLNLYFNRWNQTESYNLLYTNNSDAMLQSMLPVHRVGDYKFSIMPTKADFDNIYTSQLRVDPMAKKRDQYAF